MVLMALDVGEKLIGVATSDSGIVAMPHSVILRKSKREDFTQVQRLVTELGVERLIIGLPYSLSGHNERIGPQAQRVMRYTEALAAVVKLPFDYFDESYSTVTAQQFLNNNKRAKTPIDAAAAAVILQSYLDRRRDHDHIID
jgi:putative Holliday junction resolvase